MAVRVVSKSSRSASLQAGIAEQSEAKLPVLIVQDGAAAQRRGAASLVQT